MPTLILTIYLMAKSPLTVAKYRIYDSKTRRLQKTLYIKNKMLPILF